MPNDLFLVDTSAWLLALRKDFIPAIKDRLARIIHESYSFVNKRLQESSLLSCRFRRGDLHLAQG